MPAERRSAWISAVPVAFTLKGCHPSMKTSLTKSATSTLFSEGFAFSRVHFGLSAEALRCWSITVHLLPPVPWLGPFHLTVCPPNISSITQDHEE